MMHITLNQYIGPHRTCPDWTPARQDNALDLLARCNALEDEMVAAGVRFPENPATASGISGQAFGGWRPQGCPIGAPNSQHKEGRAVDRYDPTGDIDRWCLANQDRLAHYGIWLEHPDATLGWSHWQSIAPRSGNRVYRP